MKRIRQWLACRRLNKLVQARRASFDVQDYAKRRAAALLAAWLHGFFTAYGVAQTVIAIKKGLLP